MYAPHGHRGDSGRGYALHYVVMGRNSFGSADSVWPPLTEMSEQHRNNQNRSPNRWPLTPLISAARIPISMRPTIPLEENTFYPLKDHGSRRAQNGARGSPENHQKGILGEGALASYLGIGGEVDTALYERGDGGVDLSFYGSTINVKTVGRHRSTPALTVDTYQELRADYYALVHRVGKTNFRLVGYAPRKFVANAPIWEHDGTRYHFVDQKSLFPFPSFLKVPRR